MIADADRDGSGVIDFPEFLDMMTQKMAERDPREEMLKAFRLFDDDETGKISFKNLKRVAKELGENMTDDEIQEMIDEADRDGDGEIGEEEFMRIMKKTNLFWYAILWNNINYYTLRLTEADTYNNRLLTNRKDLVSILTFDYLVL